MRIEFRIDADGGQCVTIEEENLVPLQEIEPWLIAFSALCGDVVMGPTDIVDMDIEA